MNYRKENTDYIIKIKRGEKIIETIRNLCESEKISAAHFTMIGASYDTELAFYHLDRKEYATQLYPEPREIVSMTGNISLDKNSQEIIVHAHGVFSDENMQTIGGHVVEATVNAAAEVFLKTFENTLYKTPDEETGLKLLDL